MDAVIETDPSGRFARSAKVLGKGASKTVYKAFDRIEGREVAWNKAVLNGSEGAAHALLHTEVAVLKSLKHRNIMKFYASWADDDGAINFVTEYFHSGTLKRHRLTHKSFDLNLNPALLKRWGWQILQGLVYLHGHNPPVIHRDLKCDNIFIHGVTGEVKIGDLGLARMMEGNASMCHTCIGTPEFMAPELFEEEYNEKVDIYSFGMLLLELVTMEYPYSECKNACQIYRNVTEGVYPRALALIGDQETRDFIEMCIRYDHKRRPSARQLVKHSFFDSVRGPSPKPFCVPSSPELALDESSLNTEGIEGSLLGVNSAPPSFRALMTDEVVDRELQEEMASNGGPFGASDGPEGLPYNKAGSVASCTDSETSVLKRQFSLQHKGSSTLPFVDVINFELVFGGPGATKKLMFSFDVLSDTVEDVGLELEEEFRLTSEETDLFTHLLKEELERAMHSGKMHGSEAAPMNNVGSVLVSMSLDDWKKKRTNGVMGRLSGEINSATDAGVTSGKSEPKAAPLVSFKINVGGNGSRRNSRTFTYFDGVTRRRQSSEGRRSGDQKAPRRSFERAGVWSNLVNHLQEGPAALAKHSFGKLSQSRYKRCTDTRPSHKESLAAKGRTDSAKESDVEEVASQQKPRGDKGERVEKGEKFEKREKFEKGEKSMKRRNSLRLSNVSITPVLNQVRAVAGAVKHIKAAAVILCRNSLEGKKVFFEIRGKGGSMRNGKTAMEPCSDEDVKGSRRGAQFEPPKRSMSEPRSFMPEPVSVDMKDGCLGCMSPTSPAAKHKKSFFGPIGRAARKAWPFR